MPVVGVGLGGWVAAELAVRHPDLVERLVLVGATGLFVPGEPIADFFYASYPLDGSDLGELRAIFFADPNGALANEWIPDGRMDTEREMLRYRTFRFANRVGFRPPYLYDRQLSRRLSRYRGPALVLWGERDALVPPAHGRAYAQGLGNASLRRISGAGHSVHLERPTDLAREVVGFLSVQ
jgi:pimeloyl-ACP methyl ester carboxylesterase